MSDHDATPTPQDVGGDPGEIRARLEAEREQLSQLREDAGAESLRASDEQTDLSELSSLDQHQADVGTETFNREADLSLVEQIEAELSDVEHALDRLRQGTYGTCEACGKPIGDERLAVSPAARFCLEDQAAAEREARGA